MVDTGREYSLIKRFLIIIICLASLVGATWIVQKNITTHSDVVDYRPARDRSFILKIFNENWHWLVSQYSTDFSAEYMLDNKASSKKPEHKENLIIKTHLEDNNPTGFIAYYFKTLHEGYILFLAIDKKYRGKGYARKLMEYAIDDLKDKKANIIRLVTRVSNKPARSLYEKFGFKSYYSDDEFIRYQKKMY